MNIAFISFEYPPDTGGGGIGTYVDNASRMLAGRGHHVEVFAGGEGRSTTRLEDALTVHRIACMDREAFGNAVADKFADRHVAVDFDVLEGPEYYADARRIVDQFPDLPFVLKLHTAQCILREVNVNRYLSMADKARFIAGALRRGRIPSLPWVYRPEEDPECRYAHQADVIAAPSKSIGERMVHLWDLDPKRIQVFPLPFEPDPSFTQIDPDTHTDRVTFIGRIEARKGVLTLADAIPRVLDQYPSASFRFIGRSLPHPRTDTPLNEYIRQSLGSYANAVEFTGPVPYEAIPTYLEDTDLCAFPSTYESFGLVCLEAMAAARGVIGSEAGGMKEILQGDQYGCTVPPESPGELADAILCLLNNPSIRKQRGRAARQRVLDTYSFDAVGPQQEACYRKAIERHAVTS